MEYLVHIFSPSIVILQYGIVNYELTFVSILFIFIYLFIYLYARNTD